MNVSSSSGASFTICLSTPINKIKFYFSRVFYSFIAMVKKESGTPGVYLVGPAGKERPWCGKCHKFLKSETAPHDCSPPHLSGSHKSSSAGGRKRIRLTPKTRDALEQIFKSASKECVLSSKLKKLAAATSDKAIMAAARALKRKMKDPKAPAGKKYSKLVKRFL